MKYLIPLSTGFEVSPIHSFIDKQSEEVCCTSPSCISSYSLIDSIPNSFSINLINAIREVGLSFPTLKIYG